MCRLFSLISAQAFRRHFAVWALLVVLCGCSGSLFTPHTARYIQYRVRPHDTLRSVAMRFNISSSELLEVNNLGSARAFRGDMVIKIPYRGQSLAKEKDDLAVEVASVPREKLKAQKGSVKTVSLSAARRYIGRMLWPVRNAPVSSQFGTRWMSFHEGIDLKGDEGVDIHAAHDGIVAYSGNGLRGYGNLIVIKGDGIVTVYGHNSRNSVRVGEKVERGDVIGEVGNTGKSTGAHLHFETRVKNSDAKLVAVDPLVFFPGG